MEIKYFSWIREGIGTGEETILLPSGVATVGSLLDHLCELDERYSRVLKERVFVRVALNQVHVDHGATVTDSDEIAIFPPVTGG